MARPEIESSVQMRLYTLTKRQFIVVYLVFAAAFAFFLCIGVAGPGVMLQTKLNATCSPKPKSKGERARNRGWGKKSGIITEGGLRECLIGCWLRLWV